MSNRLLVVFPKDVTTDFLEEIVIHLFANIHHSLFTLLRIEPNDKTHAEALKRIAQAGDEVILFLGHGTSSSLYGSNDGHYKNEFFITEKNFGVFNKKTLILVACESRKLLKKAKTAGFTEGIGFGDLPTDWRDIQSARELNINAYRGLTEELTSVFRNALVEILKYSLVDYVTGELSLSQLYDLLLLRTNKRIANFYANNRLGNIPLSDALLEMKRDLQIVKNV